MVSMLTPEGRVTPESWVEQISVQMPDVETRIVDGTVQIIRGGKVITRILDATKLVPDAEATDSYINDDNLPYLDQIAAALAAPSTSPTRPNSL